MPASSSILAGLLDKNLDDKPWNHPAQNFSVSPKFIRQVYFETCKTHSKHLKNFAFIYIWYFSNIIYQNLASGLEY